MTSLPYPSSDGNSARSGKRAVLYINRSESRCGACNRSALPGDTRHETPCGWDRHPGCGALFVAVSTDYAGTEAVVQAMRPDLPFVGPLAQPGGDR